MMRQELGALITAGSILLTPASRNAVASTNYTIEQLASQSTSGVNLPLQELSPLEKFQIANQSYQTFYAETLQQVNEQLKKYSIDWISKLSDKLMQAEAYHQFAFTSYAKVITSVIESCNSETEGGPVCKSMPIIEGILGEMASNKKVPQDYNKLIADAKTFSDRALELNPNEQRYQNLNITIKNTIKILSGSK